MIFDPEKHEKLIAREWTDSLALDYLRRIVRDFDDCYSSENLWPIHPLEEIKNAVPYLTSLYFGAGGIVWGLEEIRRSGLVEVTRDYSKLLPKIYERYLAHPDVEHSPHVVTPPGVQEIPSYFLGEVGLLLLNFKSFPSATIEDKIFRLVQLNKVNPTHETLWGGSGTMMAALFMHRWTGHEKWREVFLENVNSLVEQWVFDSESGTWLWLQDLYGEKCFLLGAGHGFFGNVFPLLHGQEWIEPHLRAEIYKRCEGVVQKFAITDEVGANWPMEVRPSTPDAKYLQWCHGAPGLIMGLAQFPKNENSIMENYFLKAGEATWSAGPLAKGFSLCHGTAGNAFAFLKLFARYGDPLWLERAKSFALHAAMQADGMKQKYGIRKYSLWSGDLGVAMLLMACLNRTSDLPALDWI